MTTELKNKIYRYGIYDTRNYRYVLRNGMIYRIRRELLGTTAALISWEPVSYDKKWGLIK